MSAPVYRHWRPGDDAGVLTILAPLGWCTPERYATKFDDPGLRPEDVLLAELDGLIVGHLMLPQRRLRFGAASLPCGGIGMVVVDPAARGHGIGGGLLDAAMAHQRAAGNALVALQTMTYLVPAYGMYERRGFAPLARRCVLRPPRAALGDAGGLTARPARATDWPGLRRVIDDWGAEHAGVSLEAVAALSGPGLHVVVDGGGAVVGCYELLERAEGWQVRRPLARAGQPLPPLLAAAAAESPSGAAWDPLPVVTNLESRAYAELAPLAPPAEVDGARLMLAALGLASPLAGLAVEVAASLRREGVAPARLALAHDDERLTLDWDGRVLTMRDPIAGDPPPLRLSPAALAAAIGGAPPPTPPGTPPALWAALFPARRAEARLIDCW